LNIIFPIKKLKEVLIDMIFNEFFYFGYERTSYYWSQVCSDERHSAETLKK